MAVYRVQAPDGKVIELEGPDGASQEEILSQAQALYNKPNSTLDDLLQYGPGFLKETGKSAVRGIGNLAVAGADAVVKHSPAALVSAISGGIPLEKLKELLGLPGRMLAGGLDKELPVDPNETDAEKLWRKTTEGVATGAAAGAPMGARTLLAGAGAGGPSAIGGHMGRTTAENAGIEGSGLDLAELIGATIGGVPFTHALGPRQRVSEADLRRDYRASAQGAGGEEALLRGIEENIRNAHRAGSTTYSLADAIPPDSALGARGRAVGNSTPENALRSRLQGREADINQLIAAAMDDSGPLLGSPQAKVDVLKDAAKARLASANRRVNRPFEDLRTQPNIPEAEGMAALRELERRADVPGRSAQDTMALDEAISALQDTKNPVVRLRSQPDPRNPRQMNLREVREPGPQSRPEALSLNLAELGEKRGSLAGDAASRISPAAARRAQQEATAVVQAMPAPWGPALAEALTRGQARRAKLFTPLKEGPVGHIGGMNLGATNEAPLGILNQVVSGRSADELTTLLKQLEKGISGSTTGTARALLEHRGQGLPAESVPGIRPREGTPARTALDTLVDRTGGNSERFNNRLDVADQISTNGAAMGSADPIRMNLAQLLIRPFRTVDMMSTGQLETSRLNDIARILSNPQNLEELRRIAQFDPAARAQLSAVLPFLTLASTKE